MTKVKDDELLDGFGIEQMFDALTSQDPKDRDKFEVDIDDDIDDDTDDDDVKDLNDDADDTNNDIDDNDDIDDDSDDSTDDDTDDTSDTDDDEVELISPFVDLFSKELGWELTDEDKPKSIQELVDYMSEIIETNSQPVYASQDIAELDDFVKRGGDLKEYFEKAYGSSTVDEYNLDKEDHQKEVVRELLKIKGYSESRIDKTIERYEDAGVLEDEAQDALEIVTEHREQAKKKLLEEQKKQHEEYIKRQQNYIASVQKTIESIDSVRGVPVTKRDKLLLKDYIFKVGADGKTDFQRDYSADNRFLIESAFFTMKKDDDLTKNLKSKAQSSAVTEFKKKLKDTTSRNRSNANRDLSTDRTDMISAISRHLINPKN